MPSNLQVYQVPNTLERPVQRKSKNKLQHCLRIYGKQKTHSFGYSMFWKLDFQFVALLFFQHIREILTRKGITIKQQKTTPINENRFTDFKIFGLIIFCNFIGASLQETCWKITFGRLC